MPGKLLPVKIAFPFKRVTGVYAWLAQFPLQDHIHTKYIQQWWGRTDGSSSLNDKELDIQKQRMKILFRIRPSYRVVSSSSGSTSCPESRQPPDNKTGKCFPDLKATGFWSSSDTGTDRRLLELLPVIKRTKLGSSCNPIILSSHAWVAKIKI